MSEQGAIQSFLQTSVKARLPPRWADPPAEGLSLADARALLALIKGAAIATGGLAYNLDMIETKTWLAAWLEATAPVLATMADLAAWTYVMVLHVSGGDIDNTDDILAATYTKFFREHVPLFSTFINGCVMQLVQGLGTPKGFVATRDNPTAAVIVGKATVANERIGIVASKWPFDSEVAFFAALLDANHGGVNMNRTLVFKSVGAYIHTCGLLALHLTAAQSMMALEFITDSKTGAPIRLVIAGRHVQWGLWQMPPNWQFLTTWEPLWRLLPQQLSSDAAWERWREMQAVMLTDSFSINISQDLLALFQTYDVELGTVLSFIGERVYRDRIRPVIDAIGNDIMQARQLTHYLVARVSELVLRARPTRSNIIPLFKQTQSDLDALTAVAMGHLLALARDPAGTGFLKSAMISESTDPARVPGSNDATTQLWAEWRDLLTFVARPPYADIVATYMSRGDQTLIVDARASENASLAKRLRAALANVETTLDEYELIKRDAIALAGPGADYVPLRQLIDTPMPLQAASTSASAILARYTLLHPAIAGKDAYQDNDHREERKDLYMATLKLTVTAMPDADFFECLNRMPIDLTGVSLRDRAYPPQHVALFAIVTGARGAQAWAPEEVVAIHRANLKAALAEMHDTCTSRLADMRKLDGWDTEGMVLGSLYTILKDLDNLAAVFQLSAHVTHPRWPHDALKHETTGFLLAVCDLFGAFIGAVPPPIYSTATPTADRVSVFTVLDELRTFRTEMCVHLDAFLARVTPHHLDRVRRMAMDKVEGAVNDAMERRYAHVSLPHELFSRGMPTMYVMRLLDPQHRPWLAMMGERPLAHERWHMAVQGVPFEWHRFKDDPRLFPFLWGEDGAFHASHVLAVPTADLQRVQPTMHVVPGEHAAILYEPLPAEMTEFAGIETEAKTLVTTAMALVQLHDLAVSDVKHLRGGRYFIPRFHRASTMSAAERRDYVDDLARLFVGQEAAAVAVSLQTLRETLASLPLAEPIAVPVPPPLIPEEPIEPAAVEPPQQAQKRPREEEAVVEEAPAPKKKRFTPIPLNPAPPTVDVAPAPINPVPPAPAPKRRETPIPINPAPPAPVPSAPPPPSTTTTTIDSVLDVYAAYDLRPRTTSPIVYEASTLYVDGIHKTKPRFSFAVRSAEVMLSGPQRLMVMDTLLDGPGSRRPTLGFTRRLWSILPGAFFEAPDAISFRADEQLWRPARPLNPQIVSLYTLRDDHQGCLKVLGDDTAEADFLKYDDYITNSMLMPAHADGGPLPDDKSKSVDKHLLGILRGMVVDRNWSRDVEKEAVERRDVVASPYVSARLKSRQDGSYYRLEIVEQDIYRTLMNNNQHLGNVLQLDEKRDILAKTEEMDIKAMLKLFAYLSVRNKPSWEPIRATVEAIWRSRIFRGFEDTRLMNIRRKAEKKIKSADTVPASIAVAANFLSDVEPIDYVTLGNIRAPTPSDVGSKLKFAILVMRHTPRTTLEELDNDLPVARIVDTTRLLLYNIFDSLVLQSPHPSAFERAGDAYVLRGIGGLLSLARYVSYRKRDSRYLDQTYLKQVADDTKAPDSINAGAAEEEEEEDEDPATIQEELFAQELLAYGDALRMMSPSIAMDLTDFGQAPVAPLAPLQPDSAAIVASPYSTPFAVAFARKMVEAYGSGDTFGQVLAAAVQRLDAMRETLRASPMYASQPGVDATEYRQRVDAAIARQRAGLDYRLPGDGETGKNMAELPFDWPTYLDDCLLAHGYYYIKERVGGGGGLDAFATGHFLLSVATTGLLHERTGIPRKRFIFASPCIYRHSKRDNVLLSMGWLCPFPSAVEPGYLTGKDARPPSVFKYETMLEDAYALLRAQSPISTWKGKLRDAYFDPKDGEGRDAYVDYMRKYFSLDDTGDEKVIEDIELPPSSALGFAGATINVTLSKDVDFDNRREAIVFLSKQGMYTNVLPSWMSRAERPDEMLARLLRTVSRLPAVDAMPGEIHAHVKARRLFLVAMNAVQGSMAALQNMPPYRVGKSPTGYLLPIQAAYETGLYSGFNPDLMTARERLATYFRDVKPDPASEMKGLDTKGALAITTMAKSIAMVMHKLHDGRHMRAFPFVTLDAYDDPSAPFLMGLATMLPRNEMLDYERAMDITVRELTLPFDDAHNWGLDHYDDTQGVVLLRGMFEEEAGLIFRLVNMTRRVARNGYARTLQQVVEKGGVGVAPIGRMALREDRKDGDPPPPPLFTRAEVDYTPENINSFLLDSTRDIGTNANAKESSQAVAELLYPLVERTPPAVDAPDLWSFVGLGDGRRPLMPGIATITEAEADMLATSGLVVVDQRPEAQAADDVVWTHDDAHALVVPPTQTSAFRPSVDLLQVPPDWGVRPIYATGRGDRYLMAKVPMYLETIYSPTDMTGDLDALLHRLARVDNLVLRVAPSRIKGAGNGLFVLRPFRRGEIVTYYDGPRFRPPPIEVFDSVFKQVFKPSVVKNTFLFEGQERHPGGHYHYLLDEFTAPYASHIYRIQIGPDLHEFIFGLWPTYTDAQARAHPAADVSRRDLGGGAFINHADIGGSAPNVAYATMVDSTGKRGHVVVVALRDMVAGEECIVFYNRNEMKYDGDDAEDEEKDEMEVVDDDDDEEEGEEEEGEQEKEGEAAEGEQEKEGEKDQDVIDDEAGIANEADAIRFLEAVYRDEKLEGTSLENRQTFFKKDGDSLQSALVVGFKRVYRNYDRFIGEATVTPSATAALAQRKRLADFLDNPPMDDYSVNGAPVGAFLRNPMDTARPLFGGTTLVFTDQTPDHATRNAEIISEYFRTRAARYSTFELAIATRAQEIVQKFAADKTRV